MSVGAVEKIDEKSGGPLAILQPRPAAARHPLGAENPFEAKPDQEVVRGE